MNDYDSTKMADVLHKSHGFEKTDNVNEADPPEYLFYQGKSAGKGLFPAGTMAGV